jgi:hypothetical protein
MVTVRAAKFADVLEIVGLCEEDRKASSYADQFQSDTPTLKRLAMQYISGHAAKPGVGLIVVADNGVCLEGLFVGFMRPLYECMNAYRVTNLIWYALLNTTQI